MFKRRKNKIHVQNIERVVVDIEQLHVEECGQVSNRLVQLEKMIHKMRDELEVVQGKISNGV